MAGLSHNPLTPEVVRVVLGHEFWTPKAALAAMRSLVSGEAAWPTRRRVRRATSGQVGGADQPGVLAQLGQRTVRWDGSRGRSTVLKLSLAGPTSS
jgi:hypothetical protein